MASKVIINAKGSPDLKEALRTVAFEERLTSSAFIVKCLEANPKIAKELERLATKSAKKAK